MGDMGSDAKRAIAAFVDAVAINRCAYAVAGEDGFARVVSPLHQGHEVELLWSQSSEPARWADALVDEPRVVALGLETLLADHLPRIAAQTLFAGVDWTDEPAEAELAATDLDRQIRLRLIEEFAETAKRAREVWVLARDGRMLIDDAGTPEGGQMLPVFGARAQAEATANGPWAGAVPARLPIAEFVQATVLWCVQARCRMAPAYVAGPGLVTLQPWDLKGLLSARPQVRRIA